jgi:hypothetical protein
MAKYLTVTQYKLLDDGVLTPDVSDLALARIITRAEIAIDAHMKFDLKVGGFEPHQVWIERKWNSNSLKTNFPSFPVPIRNVQRYWIQVSNLSTSGAGYFATISPNDCVINEFAGYVEIVPLQAVTYSLAPVILQLALRDPIVQMDCEVGFYLPVFGEQLITTDYLTYYASRGFWAQTYSQAIHVQPATLPPIPSVVYANGVAQSTGFAINNTDGAVTFTAKRNSSDVITADYTTVIPDIVVEATIRQVSYLLGQRALNRQGLMGLEQIKTGDQFIRRHLPQSGNGVDVLCEAAAACLDGGIMPIAIA